MQPARCEPAAEKFAIGALRAVGKKSNSISSTSNFEREPSEAFIFNQPGKGATAHHPGSDALTFAFRRSRVREIARDDGYLSQRTVLVLDELAATMTVFLRFQPLLPFGLLKPPSVQVELVGLAH